MSRIVPTPCASLIVALVAPLKFTKNCSEPSKTVSLRRVTGMVMVMLPTPAAKFSVPFATVKSAPLVAVSFAVA